MRQLYVKRGLWFSLFLCVREGNYRTELLLVAFRRFSGRNRPAKISGESKRSCPIGFPPKSGMASDREHALHGRPRDRLGVRACVAHHAPAFHSLWAIMEPKKRKTMSPMHIHVFCGFAQLWNETREPFQTMVKTAVVLPLRNACTPGRGVAL